MELNISTNKQTYKLKEPILLTVTLCNPNDKCIIGPDITGFLLENTLSIHIVDERFRIIQFGPVEKPMLLEQSYKLYNPGDCLTDTLNLTQNIFPHKLDHYFPLYRIDDYGKYSIDASFDWRFTNFDSEWRRKRKQFNKYQCDGKPVKREQLIYFSSQSRNSITISVEGGEYKVPISHTNCPTDKERIETSQEYHPDGTQGGFMLYIPKGDFVIGLNSDEAFQECQKITPTVEMSLELECLMFKFINQQYPHIIFLDSYYIDKYEVTQSEYDQCVKAKKCSQNYRFEGLFEASQPVVGVNWEQAKSYCEFVGKRLPTEAEWEKAARGTDCRLYPWGNEFDGSRLNFCDKNCDYEDSRLDTYDDGYENTSTVGSYSSGASPYGALDMAGNVSEWCNDWYEDYIYQNDNLSNPKGPISGHEKVIRSSGYRSAFYNSLVTFRNKATIDLSGYELGFRCARSE